MTLFMVFDPCKNVHCSRFLFYTKRCNICGNSSPRMKLFTVFVSSNVCVNSSHGMNRFGVFVSYNSVQCMWEFFPRMKLFTVLVPCNNISCIAWNCSQSYYWAWIFTLQHEICHTIAWYCSQSFIFHVFSWTVSCNNMALFTRASKRFLG
jgi:hypothetical protein